MNRHVFLHGTGCACLLLLLSLSVAGTASATAYECRNDNGSVTLQDQPCAAAQQLLRQMESPKQLAPRHGERVRTAAAPDSLASSGGPSVIFITQESGKLTQTRPYTGDMSSPVKRFMVRAYAKRCRDALMRTVMARQWTPVQMTQFCTCVGGSLYDTQANMSGLKDMLLNHGHAMEAAANAAAPGCVVGPMVPQWQEKNGG